MVYLRIDLDDPESNYKPISLLLIIIIERARAEARMQELVKALISEIERIDSIYLKLHIMYQQQFRTL